MLPLQFYGQNFHFAVNLFAALVFFFVFWLYLDAWNGRKNYRGFLKWAGFLALALSSLFDASIIEQAVLGKSLFGGLTTTLVLLLKIFGYLAIIGAELLDPLQAVPKNTGLQLEKEALTDTPSATTSSLPQADSSGDDNNPEPKFDKNSSATAVFGVGSIAKAVIPLASFTIAALYWRRATTGLEKHLRPVAIAFAFIATSDLLSLATIWRGTDNPIIFRLVAPFGQLWLAQHLIFLVGVGLLGRWVWHYLIKRFQSQLFIIFTNTIAAIFMVSTISFTFMILSNIQHQTLNNLSTASKVLSYAIDSKTAETKANAEVVAHNPSIVAALAANDRKQLQALTSDFLTERHQSLLTITTDTGKVLLRADDPSRSGDSLSGDPLVRRALLGGANSSITTKEDVIAPLIYIETAVPIRNAANSIIGAAVVGLVADNSFVDGIKHSTGLDSSIYSGNVRSATTFVAPDGKSRLVGVKETHKSITQTVIKKGKSFTGVSSLSNRPYLVAYSPLKDVDASPVGMLLISQPQSDILRTAGRSIELTFLLAVVLILLAIVPAHLISRYIAKQLK